MGGALGARHPATQSLCRAPSRLRLARLRSREMPAILPALAWPRYQTFAERRLACQRGLHTLLLAGR